MLGFNAVHLEEVSYERLVLKALRLTFGGDLVQMFV